MRGAITTENTKIQISHDTITLIEEIIKNNNIDINDITAIFFSTTKDINKIYPAEAVRQYGITSVPMMCFQEMDVENSLKKCIRVIMFVNFTEEKKIKHIYLKDAKNLRPDLI
ncbi:MAG: chorismate mutase [Thermoanaerobacteraceae bacterium]